MGQCWMLVLILASGMRTIGRVLTRLPRSVTWLAALSSAPWLSPPAHPALPASILPPRQLRYGASPGRSSKITYQPDVVFVGSPDSIVSVSADGEIWTISGSAPNVNELRPGKIMFREQPRSRERIQSRGTRANRQVVLGPVTITDVIRDGTFSSSAPIPLNDVEAYTVPSEPGLLTKTIADVTTPTSGDTQDPSDTDAQAPIQLASAPEPHGVGSNTVTLPAVDLVASSQVTFSPASLGILLTAASGTLPAPSPSPAPTSWATLGSIRSVVAVALA